MVELTHATRLLRALELPPLELPTPSSDPNSKKEEEKTYDSVTKLVLQSAIFKLQVTRGRFGGQNL